MERAGSERIRFFFFSPTSRERERSFQEMRGFHLIVRQRELIVNEGRVIHGTRLHRSTVCTTRSVTLREHISSSMRIKELSSLMNKFISLTARSNFRDVALV